MSKRWFILCHGILIAGLSCGSPVSPVPPPAERVAVDWVTPRVASFLSSEGIFHNIDETPEYVTELSKGGGLEINMALNNALATGVGGLREAIEAEHGRKIDFRSLLPCQRTFYLRSIFLPIDSGPGFDRATGLVGGRWLSVFCTPDGTPTVLVLLFAGTKIRVEAGRLVFPPVLGSDFNHNGIPLSRPSLTYTPERAVRLVFEATGRRVSEVPEAFLDITNLARTTATSYKGPVGVFWRIRTEVPVTYISATSGVTRNTDTFYAVLGYSGFDPARIYVSETQLPEPFWIRINLPGSAPDSVLLTPRALQGLVPLPSLK